MGVITDPKQMETYSTPEQIAEVVYEAATDGKDQLRYVAGPDAKATYAMRLQLGDEAFRKAIGSNSLGKARGREARAAHASSRSGSRDTLSSRSALPKAWWRRRSRPSVSLSRIKSTTRGWSSNAAGIDTSNCLLDLSQGRLASRSARTASSWNGERSP